MIGKPLLIIQNRKLLQHKFSVFGHICRMKAADALQALKHRSKSRNLTKSVAIEAKP
ncbi:hypothetical protein QT971_22660 [Microcoleus sp. herbarium19]|uniref:hypothetical protein n=1 Tax=unclassified Microcoleus TaxID=2642155 RepID=UPI002FD1B964